MQVESLAIRMRPRSPLEAADLGVRLCQSSARQVYLCYLAAWLPVSILSLATIEIVVWLPFLLIWWLKPWMDRTILFVLSRAAFAQETRPLDLWASQRDVWWRQLVSTLTLRRLSPWRSFTQPVYQLEGLPWHRRSSRVVRLRGGRAGTALLMNGAFSLCETSLLIALASLGYWFAPQSVEVSGSMLFSDSPETTVFFVLTLLYALVVLFLEPFYVAAGFAMYLNRRTELEAWDIEQEFRRAFAH